MNLPLNFLRVLPVLPPWWITGAVRAVCGSRRLRRFLRGREIGVLAPVQDPRRILLIADVNIGDSINIQPAAEVLNARFPGARIDYVHSSAAAPLVENNPALARSFPLFKGRFVPGDSECEKVRRLVVGGDYDLILSFCPFLPERVLEEAPCPVLTPIRLICSIVAKACARNGARAGITENLAEYVGQIANDCVRGGDDAAAPSKFAPKIYLAPESLVRRDEWLRNRGLSAGRATVFFNPDASNLYTLLPRDRQVELLERLLADEACEQLLLGSGFTFEGIERSVLGRVDGSLRSKVTIVSRDLPIEAYAALIDMCEVFITPDTGPMHIAAAQKICLEQEGRFRNRTSIIGLFGPTLPRVYGYDSCRAGFTPANQDAPSRVFEARCVRKNLTCSLARIAEQCSGESCFRGLDPGEVADCALRFLREPVRNSDI